MNTIKHCSGIKTTGYWKGKPCGSIPKYKTNDGKCWCKNHLPQTEILTAPSGDQRAKIRLLRKTIRDLILTMRIVKYDAQAGHKEMLEYKICLADAVLKGRKYAKK